MAFTRYEKDGLRWTSSDLLPVKNIFTGRLGDIGEYPYSSSYDPVWLSPEMQGRVDALWTRFFRAAELPERGCCFAHQVHGVAIRRVTKEELCHPPLPVVPEDCDGLITNEPGVPLCVFGADCLPVLLCDAQHGIVCAVHSGWKGTAKDMMGSAVRSMCALGAKTETIRAALGPAISKCCFEVGPEVKEAFEALLGADADGVCPPEEGVPGKFMADIKETNRRRLLQLGVRNENIDILGDCTMCMSDIYWSHRATHGVRGTQAAVIML